MNPCPCGLTREELVELAKIGLNILDANLRCTAESADGSQCGRRLADHPHAPPGKNIFLLKINISDFQFSAQAQLQLLPCLYFSLYFFPLCINLFIAPPQLIAQSQSNSSPVVSKRNFGRKIVSDLSNQGMYKKFLGGEGATIQFEDYLPPVPATDETKGNEDDTAKGEKKSSREREIKYVRNLRPIFEEIFSVHELQAVDSQAFPWLVDTLGASNKPDLFLAPRWAYMTRNTIKNPKESLCGVVPFSKLYNSVYIFDCKIDMNDEALAELFFHLQLLNSSAPNPLQVSKGMLFGPGGCYLCTCTGQDITELECCATGTPGLVNKLQEFFSPFPYQAILSSVLMSSFKLEIVKPVEDYETSYLGAGAYGQVFKVKRDPEFNDNNLYALKIVNSHYDRFCREFSILYMHTKIECDCNLIASVPSFSSLLTFDDQHAAFVMSPVGVGLKRDDIVQKQ
jgi:hypothetical protein